MKPQGGWKKFGHFYPLTESYGLAFGQYWTKTHSDWAYEEFDAAERAVHRLLGGAAYVDPANWRSINEHIDYERGKAWYGVETKIPTDFNKRPKERKSRNPRKYSSYGQRVYIKSLCGHEISVYVTNVGQTVNVDRRKRTLSSKKCVYCLVDEWTESLDPVKRILKAMKGE